ncbi:MAG: ATP synthase F1 subunit gamma [Candidatus Nomurabacteria bacterium]|nr:ATP synthase F1 subunit gamma [Candidatus Nomurabacteria bacterium]
MALQAKHIKEKIKAVGNIKKITKTMEMVSVSKMRRAVAKTTSSREFGRFALELLVNLGKDRGVEHPLIATRETGKTLMVVVASNKGLAGGYNINIDKAVRTYKSRHNDSDVDVITIGKQSEKIARRQGLNIVASFTDFSESLRGDEVRIMVNMFIDKYSENDEYKNVVVAYTQFIKPAEYRPTVRQIIPVHPKVIRNIIETPEDGRSDERFEKDSLKEYLFEPNPEEVLDVTLPSLLLSVMFQILLESTASEHSSRMVAMKAATDNAGELQDELSLSYNKARQAAITQEIAEIVGGSIGS